MSGSSGSSRPTQRLIIGNVTGDNNAVQQTQRGAARNASNQESKVGEVKGSGNKFNQLQENSETETKEEEIPMEEEEGPMKITMKYGSQLHGGHDCYEIQPQANRGKVLIININKFNGGGERKGSKVDVQNLEYLFDKMGGFKGQVKVVENLSAIKIQLEVSRFSGQGFSNTDIVVVVIMTHGDKLDSEGEVMYGSDNGTFKESDITNLFSEENVPKLKGKPKLFLFQACRGSVDPDHPDDASDSTLSDIIVLHGTESGYTSKRNPYDGTYFIRAFCHAVMENACDNHLTELVPKMQDYIKSKNRKQIISMYPKKTPKKLYFNPFPDQEQLPGKVTKPDLLQ